MNNITFDTEVIIRLILFTLFFALLAVAELIWPRRPTNSFRGQRWLANLGLSVLNTFTVRLIIPVAGVTAALWAQDSGIGLFNLVAWSTWLELVLFVVLFDLTVYWQHRIFHWLQPLWRLHRVHHTDEGYDLTTGVRFHPLSILLSAALKTGLAVILGASAAAVLVAELLLNLTSLFNHSNVRLPAWLDNILRLVVVTPDMHRVHHSTNFTEHSRNFGFSLSCWDRLFGTYLQDPLCPRATMPTGIDGYSGVRTRGLLALLIQPFVSGPVVSGVTPDRVKES